jgi:hypothetical protein
VVEEEEEEEESSEEELLEEEELEEEELSFFFFRYAFISRSYLFLSSAANASNFAFLEEEIFFHFAETMRVISPNEESGCFSLTDFRILAAKRIYAVFPFFGAFLSFFFLLVVFLPLFFFLGLLLLLLLLLCFFFPYLFPFRGQTKTSPVLGQTSIAFGIRKATKGNS